MTWYAHRNPPPGHCYYCGVKLPNHTHDCPTRRPVEPDDPVEQPPQPGPAPATTGSGSGIRSCGPGKFDTILDSYVYELFNEGMGSEECGDVQTTGWYGTIHLGPDALREIERVAADDGDTLTDEERDLILDSGAAIISEDNQGFVGVDYYDDDPEGEEQFNEDWLQTQHDADADTDLA